MSNLVIRVRGGGKVNSYPVKSFQFQDTLQPTNTNDLVGNYFLRCLACGFDEFDELFVNQYECSECSFRVDVIGG